MKELKRVLRDTLTPIGFKCDGSSCLHYRDRILLRVSTYASRFDDTAFIDICITYSDVPIRKQDPGDWHAMIRIEKLLPEGRSMEPLIKKVLSVDEARDLASRLNEDFLPFLGHLMTDQGILDSLRLNKCWHKKSKVIPMIIAYLNERLKAQSDGTRVQLWRPAH